MGFMHILRCACRSILLMLPGLDSYSITLTCSVPITCMTSRRFESLVLFFESRHPIDGVPGKTAAIHISFSIHPEIKPRNHGPWPAIWQVGLFQCSTASHQAGRLRGKAAG
ncbi:hypothetical protein BDW69DRAFT_177664 [Aspergillus filifer]